MLAWQNWTVYKSVRLPIDVYKRQLQSMGLGKINFLNTPGLTIFVVSFISIWRSFGISAIIYVTAIQQVSASLYEAAEMDGAGKIRQFWHITAPSIRPTFWYILMTRFAGALQIFDIIYITTNGGPNYTTESTVTYISVSYTHLVNFGEAWRPVEEETEKG